MITQYKLLKILLIHPRKSLYMDFSTFHSVSLPHSSTSPCTAPAPHPAPVKTEAHPMAKQSDGQSKPLFSSLYQLYNRGQYSLMKQLFMCWNELILS